MPDFEELHRKNLALYLKQVDAIYNEAVKQASIIGRNVPNFNPDKPFYFADYPAVKKKIDKLLDTFHSQQFTAIVNGVDSEWTLANNKNNELCNSVFGEQTNLPKALAEKYYKNNHLAREAFKQRTVRGLNLSDRVWRYTNQFKQELEMSIEVALSSGKPANRLATDLKKYLQQPDKLFRRVRDKYGNLQLSKRAKSYHPGRGVYRSSYKNARRLAATETNIAYRTSDYERLQDLDFVVGIEIKLSNNHTLNGIPFTDICDTLMGKYPKDFKFTGWHPLCRCHSTTILKTEEEMSNDNEKILEGKEPQNRSVNKVRTAPNEFNTWVKDNKTRMKNAKSLPYFLKDNRIYVNRANKVKATTPKIKPKPDISVLDNTLASIENDIRKNKNFETAVIIDSKGNVLLDKRGQARSVSFTLDEAKLMRNNILTHNHPGGWRFPEGSMLRIGNSFSDADILTAIRNNMLEVRAVTPNFTFTMRRPEKGWPNWNEAKDRMKELDFELTRDFFKRINTGKTTMAKCEVVHYHTLWKRFAHEFGITYTKAKTN